MNKYKVTQQLIDFVASFEGCYLSSYDDLQPKKKLTSYSQIKGTLTIGYGHTGRDVYINQTITKEKAKELLQNDLQSFANRVNALPYDLTEKQFISLVSFAFNCGTGNLTKLTEHNTRTKREIANNMIKFCYSKGIFLKGLYNRRVKEQEMFSSDIIYEDFSNIRTKIYLEEVGHLKQICKNSKGTSVRVLQAILNITVDGVFGANTDTKVKQFQKNNDLSVDGIVGTNTWNKLFSTINS